MIRKLGALVLVVGAVLVAGCGDDGDEAAGARDTTGAPAGSMAATAAGRLELAGTSVGRVLVDAEGRTVYLLTRDAQGDSTCYDDCEKAWPVVGELAGVGEGLDPSLLGTTTREDGTVQATYNDWPLYHFAGDGAPGEVNGQGLQGVWWVLDAEGRAVETAPAADAASSTTAASPRY